MFDELRELAAAIRDSTPRVVELLESAVTALVMTAESLARIADRYDSSDGCTRVGCSYRDAK